jgi:hypothetical protein
MKTGYGERQTKPFAILLTCWDRDANIFLYPTISQEWATSIALLGQVELFVLLTGTEVGNILQLEVL